MMKKQEPKLSIRTDSINVSKREFDHIDKLIDRLTAKVVSMVEGAKHFGIMTACFIDGEFGLVSEFAVSDALRDRLKAAAMIAWVSGQVETA